MKKERTGLIIFLIWIMIAILSVWYAAHRDNEIKEERNEKISI